MSLSAAHTMHASLPVRWAALTHDLGKALTPANILPRHHGHEAKGKAPLNELHKRLKTPKDCAELALFSAEFHTHVHRAMELKPSTIMKLFNTLDAWRK